MKCLNCHRDGSLVVQQVHKMDGKAIIYRLYLCRYHLAAANRSRGSVNFSKLTKIDFIEDEILLGYNGSF